MKRSCVLFIVVFAMIVCLRVDAIAQVAIRWEKSLGGTSYDGGWGAANGIYDYELVSIEQTRDGGFIAAGRSQSNDGDVTGNHGDADYWIVKLDAAGVLQWQESLGGTGFDVASSAQETLDGGYIVAGASQSTDDEVIGAHGGFDFWIVKFDSTHAIQWTTALGSPANEYAYCIRQLPDSGYIVAGISDSTGSNDYRIVRLNEEGVEQWQVAYGGSGMDIARAIEPTRDSGFIVAGYSNSTDGDVTGNHGGTDAWIVKLDSLGTMQWEKSLGGAGEDNAYDIQQTYDGGYIFAGSSTSTDTNVQGNHGASDCWVVKLDSNGGRQWEECLGGSAEDFATSIRQTADSGFIVLGNSFSNDGEVTGNHGISDYWVVKLSQFGALEWEQSLGGSNNDEPGMIRQTADGGYIVSGQSFSNDGDVTGNHGASDFWIVRLENFPEISGTLQNIGTVLCGGVIDTTVQILNIGTDILRIDSIKVIGVDSAAFAVTTFFPVFVPVPDYANSAKSAGTTIGIRFTPRHGGQSNAALIVYSNDTAHARYAMPIYGIKDSIGIASDRSTINFGDVLACVGDTAVTVRITNTGSASIDNARIEIRGSAAFSLKGVNAYSVDTGGYTDITIHFSAQNSILYNGALILYTPCDSLLIPLTAKGVTSKLTVEGSNFGSICSGDSVIRYLSLSNTGDTAIVITSAAVSAPFRVDSPAVPFTIPTGDTVLLRGFFVPVADGEYNSVLRLTGVPCNITDTAIVKGQSGTPVLSAD
ncbi:MAG TPA: choice-of-anchor D domain-containing protein, partial [Candidatus Kapabacteria bacterium]|nr:choice-of-anchor D domain-containing protein [Candidatus Kapabacteria bacterium]